MKGLRRASIYLSQGLISLERFIPLQMIECQPMAEIRVVPRVKSSSLFGIEDFFYCFFIKEEE